MRKAMRFQNNSEYWDERWMNSGSDPESFKKFDIYPIIHAEMVVPQAGGCIGELGCGLGRIVKHYHSRGYRVVGMERSDVAVRRMKEDDKSLRVVSADARRLPFGDGAFDTILSFGLYHNIEEGMQGALDDAARCLKKGGRFAIAVRPDNFEMRLNERYWRFKHRHKNKGQEYFHKWLCGEKEFRAMLEEAGLVVTEVQRARIVSLFWRLPFLRARAAQPERENRASGYRLNAVGWMLDRLTTFLFPASFCNILVFLGRKECEGSKQW